MKTSALVSLLLGVANGLGTITLPSKTQFVAIQKFTGTLSLPNTLCGSTSNDRHDAWIVGLSSTPKCVQGYTRDGTIRGKWRKATMNDDKTKIELEFFDGASCSGTKHTPVLAGGGKAQQFPASITINLGLAVTADECMIDPDDQFSSLSVEYAYGPWSPVKGTFAGSSGQGVAMSYFSQTGASDGGSAGCIDAGVQGAIGFKCDMCYEFGSAPGTTRYNKLTCSTQGVSIQRGYLTSTCGDVPSGAKTLRFGKNKCYAGGDVDDVLPNVAGMAWELLDCGDVSVLNSQCGTAAVYFDLSSLESAVEELVRTIVIIVLVSLGCCCCVIVSIIIGVIICCVTGVAGCAVCVSKKPAQVAQPGVMMQQVAQPVVMMQQVVPTVIVPAEPAQATVVGATVVKA